MTEDERKMLRDLHAAFMSPPPGGDTPLINDIVEVVTVYRRGSWMVRASLWFLATMGGLIITWRQIWEWWSK